jgi:hypothetical protein
VGTGIIRNSWSVDNQFFLKASVTLSGEPESLLPRWADTSIIVFKGDPAERPNIPLFMSHYQNHTVDIHKELDEAERVGHAYIASLG